MRTRTERLRNGKIEIRLRIWAEWGKRERERGDGMHWRWTRFWSLILCPSIHPSTHPSIMGISAHFGGQAGRLAGWMAVWRKLSRFKMKSPSGGMRGLFEDYDASPLTAVGHCAWAERERGAEREGPDSKGTRLRSSAEAFPPDREMIPIWKGHSQFGRAKLR